MIKDTIEVARKITGAGLDYTSTQLEVHSKVVAGVVNPVQGWLQRMADRLNKPMAQSAAPSVLKVILTASYDKGREELVNYLTKKK